MCPLLRAARRSPALWSERRRAAPRAQRVPSVRKTLKRDLCPSSCACAALSRVGSEKLTANLARSSDDGTFPAIVEQRTTPGGTELSLTAHHSFHLLAALLTFDPLALMQR